MSPGQKVVLVGLMGTGKSTVAAELARRLGVSVADTDDIVERDAGRSVREIFATDGEDVFRAMESRALEVALASDAPVVAAAGGVVVSPYNRDMLNREREAGRVVVVWLRATAATTAARTAGGEHRPLLDTGAEAALERLSVERFAYYSQVSDAVIDTDGIDVGSVVERVLEIAGEGTR